MFYLTFFFLNLEIVFLLKMEISSRTLITFIMSCYVSKGLEILKQTQTWNVTWNKMQLKFISQHVKLLIWSNVWFSTKQSLGISLLEVRRRLHSLFKETLINMVGLTLRVTMYSKYLYSLFICLHIFSLLVPFPFSRHIKHIKSTYFKQNRSKGS